MKTTTFKTMMAMAFAAFAMTANANTDPMYSTWRNTTTTHKMEVRHDNRNNRHYEANWKTCRHNHLDRYGNKTFCHTCGVEMIWKGNNKNGHFDVVAPHAGNNKNYGGRNDYNTGNKNNGGRNDYNTGNKNNGGRNDYNVGNKNNGKNEGNNKNKNTVNHGGPTANHNGNTDNHRR